MSELIRPKGGGGGGRGGVGHDLQHFCSHLYHGHPSASGQSQLFVDGFNIRLDSLQFVVEHLHLQGQFPFLSNVSNVLSAHRHPQLH